jgi:putative flavoprotein involved in K+ transport
MADNSRQTDVLVIGGGQSGLAVGYFLNRLKVPFAILDEQPQPGGAWLHGWDSLRLFSPAEHSSLPGWMMPRSENEYPGKQEVIDYLRQYEERYKLPVHRPVRVKSVQHSERGFNVKTSEGTWHTKALICATGSWSKPYIPAYPNIDIFKGQQLHSARYQNPAPFTGQKVLIVGGGNSGAQLLAEVSKVAQTVWVTEREPKLLPDEVDGRYLFEFATRQYKAKLEGKTIEPAGSLGDVVMVASVQEARQRNVLHSVRPFTQFTETGVQWPDGREEAFNAVIWCTGFKPALDFLQDLDVLEPNGKVSTQGTRAIQQEGLWLVGYGSWTGFASATLIGVGRSARATADEVKAWLDQQNY